MAKKFKIDSGDHDSREVIEPPPPYLEPEGSTYNSSYENPYPAVPEPLPEPSAPPAQETAIYVQDMNDLPPSLPPLRIRENNAPFYASSHPEHRPLLQNEDAPSYRYQGFPSAALIFLFGWLCPPLWLIGACCCLNSRNPFNVWWARASLVMFLFTLISTLVAGSIVISIGPETWRIRISLWVEKVNSLTR